MPNTITFHCGDVKYLVRLKVDGRLILEEVMQDATMLLREKGLLELVYLVEGGDDNPRYVRWL